MSRKKVLAIGDSLVYGYGLKEENRWVNGVSSQLDLDLVNLSVSGSTVQDVIKQYERIKHDQFDFVLMGFGMNDVAQMMDKRGALDFNVLEERSNNLLMLLDNLDIPILYVSVHHVVEKTYYQRHPQKMYKKISINESLGLFNDWIRKRLELNDIWVVDLFNDDTFKKRRETLLRLDDGLHYSKEGSTFVANKVLEKLEEQL
ncbi:SGNH/GDSL hydrolase family protein [Erysipelothrix urinaevulpis]|uniref:SGNH/GDSL hydrolase family protein n=1 Tax=Erysipelothrix urinaevulpis TaxID=2683717 RepID=UPI00135AE5D0|nr:SGNH/GDSL hydrolase family protein [Erysipelothrix urinaevulpis]